MPLLKSKERYSYQDYITWDDNERWEIIDGTAYNMAPAPKLDHQTVVLRFGSFFDHQLRGKKCKPFIAPTDVILSEHDVVQPDVLVVCDSKKYENGKNIQGAPEVIIEVLSPSTEQKDRIMKKELYAKYGVKEYILVNPESLFAEQFVLQSNGKYDFIEIYNQDQTMTLQSLEGIIISLAEIFTVSEQEQKQ